jgi:hypothetical protein
VFFSKSFGFVSKVAISHRRNDAKRRSGDRPQEDLAVKQIYL